MRKITILLFALFALFESSFCQYSVGITPFTTNAIYCHNGTAHPSFAILDGGGSPVYASDVLDNSGIGYSGVPLFAYTLTRSSGGATMAWSTNSPSSTENDAPALSGTTNLTGCVGGVTNYCLKVIIKYQDQSGSPQTNPLITCQTLTILGEYPVGNGGPSPDDFCSFQFVPTSDASACPTYPGTALEFTYGTIPTAYSVADCNNDGYSPYFIAPGPQATYYSYSITPGWSYVYTTTPGTVMIIPPAPSNPQNHPAYSFPGAIYAMGSGAPVGNSFNCVASTYGLPLQVDYPADSPTHHYIDTTYTPPFNNWTNVAISSITGYYDLKTKGYITLNANLTCNRPTFVSVDWYEVDNTGKLTEVASATNSITVKVVGDYIAKVNLAQGSTVNPITGARQNYSGSTYYIAQSNIAEVYNSSSSTANVDSMGVYPNPVCGKVTVNYLLSGAVSTAKLIITNVSTGSIVLQENLYTTQQTQSVDISTLPNGTYIATVQVNGVTSGSDSRTFVIMCGN